MTGRDRVRDPCVRFSVATMAETHPELKAVVELVKQLNPIDKVRLLERVIPDLEDAIRGADRRPLHLSYGAPADL